MKWKSHAIVLDINKRTNDCIYVCQTIIVPRLFGLHSLCLRFLGSSIFHLAQRMRRRVYYMFYWRFVTIGCHNHTLFYVQANVCATYLPVVIDENIKLAYRAPKEPTLMKSNLDYSMGNHTFRVLALKMIADTSPSVFSSRCSQMCVCITLRRLTQNKCKFIVLFESHILLSCLVTVLRSVASVVLQSSTLSRSVFFSLFFQFIV